MCDGDCCGAPVYRTRYNQVSAVWVSCMYIVFCEFAQLSCHEECNAASFVSVLVVLAFVRSGCPECAAAVFPVFCPHPFTLVVGAPRLGCRKDIVASTVFCKHILSEFVVVPALDVLESNFYVIYIAFQLGRSWDARLAAHGCDPCSDIHPPLPQPFRQSSQSTPHRPHHSHPCVLPLPRLLTRVGRHWLRTSPPHSV